MEIRMITIAKKIFSIVLMCILYICMSGEASAATINKPTNNLGMVGYWTFDGKDMTPNVRDLSGNSYHGILTGQSATTTVIGKIGQALAYDGVDDVVTTPNITQMVGASGLTVSGWYKFNSATASADQYFISKYTNSANYVIRMFRDPNEAIRCMVYTTAGVTAVTPHASVANTDWNHIACVYDGATVSIYINGVLSGTPAAQTGTTHATNIASVQIGLSDFMASLDDVRIYNRALSAGEIKAQSNHGAAKVGNKNTALANGLVGHWTFDGKDMTPNVRDASGNGNHGALVNFTSTTTATAAGKLGQALQFDNINDYVSIPDTNSLSFTNGSGQDLPYSASVWVNMNDISEDAAIISKAQNFSSFEWGILIQGNSLVAQSLQMGTFSAVGRSGTLSLSHQNRWVHVVITYDGSETNAGYKIYIDGVRFDTTDAGGGAYTGMSNTTSIIQIGSYFGSGYFNGKIDDMRFYNRVLADTEIRQLYNLGAGTKANVSSKGLANSNLVAHYTFDGKDMRPNVRDVSGNGNHGTLNGQAATTTAIGKIGQALQFDGVDDYVNLGDSSVVDFGSGDFAMTAWIYNTGQATRDGIINKDVSGGRQFYFILNADNTGSVSAGKLSAKVYTTDTVGFGIDSSAGVVSPNEWHHVVYTRLSGSQSLYLNGTALSVTTNSSGGGAENAALANTSTNLTIGRREYSGFTDEFEGKIDDVRVYNKGLSATEVKALYNMGK